MVRISDIPAYEPQDDILTLVHDVTFSTPLEHLGASFVCSVLTLAPSQLNNIEQ